MDSIQTSTRIHPLMACAALSVMLVSLLGVAAITGILPSSHGSAAVPVAAAPNAENVANAVAPYSQYPAPGTATIVHHKHVVHRAPPTYTQAQPATQYADNSANYGRGYSQQPLPQPVQQPAAQTNYLGIATGAVIGGLLGHQVGGGNGRTLATIAGAVGGGYLGNEVEKRMP